MNPDQNRASSPPDSDLPGFEDAPPSTSAHQRSDKKGTQRSLTASLQRWKDLSRYMPTTVSPAFLDVLARHFPEVAAGDALRRLFVYLALGSYRHRDIPKLQLPYPLLAAIAGELTPSVLSQEYYDGALPLLRAMQDALGEADAEPRFQWTEHRAGRQPRLVDRLELPEAMQEVVGRELRRTPEAGDVVVVGAGEQGTEIASQRALRTLRQDREAEAEVHVRAAESYAYSPSLDVLRYLNRLPTNTFTMLANSNAAGAWAALDQEHAFRRQVAAGITDAAHAKDELQRADQWHDMQARLLRACLDHPKPHYRATRNSARLFPVGASPAHLSAPIRRALFQGYVEVDLRSAYFGIAPLFLDVPVVQETLQAGGVIWERLMLEMGLGAIVDEHGYAFKAIKGVLKHAALYPLFTGQSRRNTERRIEDGLRRELARALGPAYEADLVPEGVGHAFLRSDLARDVLRARRTYENEATSRGYVEDHRGRRIALPGYRGPADHRLRQDATAFTALTYVQSEVEMELMKAVVDLQRSGERVRVLLWQHDGCTVQVQKPSRPCTGCAIQRVQDAVGGRARELGVETELEVEDDPDGLSSRTCAHCRSRVWMRDHKPSMEQFRAAMELIEQMRGL